MAEDYTEIVRNLRKNARMSCGFSTVAPILRDDQWEKVKDHREWKAADAITQLLAERDALREAAKPFAIAATSIEKEISDDNHPIWIGLTRLTLAHFRRIRAALNQGGSA